MPSAETALTGKIPTQILRNALPGVIAMLASAAPVLLDALLLSRSGSDHAAAAAAGYPVFLLMQTIGFTLGTGAGSHVSRCLGQGDRENALRAASTAFFLSLLLSGALCMVGFMLVLPLSRLLGTDAASMNAACGYIRYVLLCGPLLCMNLVLGSLLRAQAQAVANMIAYVSGGCIGCALAKHLPGSRVVLGDISPGARAIARKNILLNDLGRQAICMEADALSPAPGNLGQYDLLVSNPPYITPAEILTLDPSVKDWEPRLALDGGEDGYMFYRSIISGWKSVLKDNGSIILELGEGQAPTVKDLLAQAGFQNIGGSFDTLGVERVVYGTLSSKN